VPSEVEHPALEALRARLDEEEGAYAEVLAAVDRLAVFALPAEAAPEIRDRLERLNVLWPAPERPAGGGLGAGLRRRAWDAVAPALERQTQFNAALVQLLNAYVAQSDRLLARLRELSGALVRYAQRIQPLVDARDRVATALATTRSELVLESFDRRLESLGRRLAGLLALRDRLEAVSEEVRGRFRGREEDARRLIEHVDHLRDCAPVVDLGCGRGELLEALRTAGVAARGVEGNANAVRECREKGLEVAQGDLVDFLRAQASGSLGGVFAAQMAERLSPPALGAMLAEAHRALRPGGLLLLEAVNPRSVIGLLEVFYRDPTNERPLHPDTLRFLAAAAGFTDVRVEMRSPVAEGARLQPVPIEGMPPRAAAALNENLERLNELLYGPLEYALAARR
jgi:O-antigen chain-terminating methyltransferase